MILLKKLIFAPFFIIFFAILLSRLKPLLASYDFVFSLSLNTFFDMIILSTLVILTSLFFVLLFTVSSNWKISLPLAAAGSLFSFIFISPTLALIFAVTTFVSLLLAGLNLDIALKSYLNFQPSALLKPSIRYLSMFLILSFCIIYFFSVSKIISKEGFQLPDALLDASLKFASPSSSGPLDLQQTSITSDQMAILKQNPDLLKQFGLSADMLDTLPANITKPSQNTNLIKQTIKNQVQGIIKPYIDLVPGLLTLILFLTLLSLVSLLNILITPLLWIIFYILEKTKFITFTTEMRPVKKMVV